LHLRGGHQWEGGGYKEGGLEGEYGGNILYIYVNGKMRPVETISGMSGGGIKEND
jgi:hypothetical protein